AADLRHRAITLFVARESHALALTGRRALRIGSAVRTRVEKGATVDTGANPVAARLHRDVAHRHPAVDAAQGTGLVAALVVVARVVDARVVHAGIVDRGVHRAIATATVRRRIAAATTQSEHCPKKNCRAHAIMIAHWFADARWSLV